MGIRVLFAAGGTGGHINPGVAVAEDLCDRSSCEVLFVGVGRDAEKQVLADTGFPHEILPFVPFTGKGLLGLLRLVCALPLGLFRGLRLIRRFKPNVVVGCGGYPSVLPVICGWLCQKRIVMLEPNVQVGRANLLLGRIAHRIFAAPGAKGFAKPSIVQYLSNPVRKRFSEINELELSSAAQGLTVLVVGGSQGASALNDAVLAQVPFLKEKQMKLIHQTGNADLGRVQEAYFAADYELAEVHAFLPHIWENYAKAHLIIARAGAMTVAEIAASGRPAIFVPLRAAAGHQRENTKALEEAGAAFVLEQDEHLEAALGRILDYLTASPMKLVEMGKQAKKFSTVGGKHSAAEIADWIVQNAQNA